jgi:tetratricopeptide (TPR) repeat protein
VTGEPLCVVVGPRDSVFEALIAPAVREAGLHPVRSDASPLGRDALVLADFAVVDLTGADPALYCALGARQALRAHATVFVHGGEYDQARITADLLAAREATFPAFRLVDDLPADVARLKTDTFRERARYPPDIKARLAEARAQGEPAVRAAEQSLEPLTDVEAGVLVDLMLSYRAVSAWTAMLQLIDRMSPMLRRTLIVQEQTGFALNRAGHSDEAERTLRATIAEHGPSSETYALLGRVYKDRWESVRLDDAGQAREHLDAAIDAYRRGFEADWRDSYPGVNAVTLMEVRDPGGSEQHELTPVVRYANRRRLEDDPDYWDQATRLELAIVSRDRTAAAVAATAALDVVRESWEPETTAYTLSLIREARALRGERLEWAEAIEADLRSRAAQSARPS